MLRLEPLFSLEKDVFPKIPREHLLVPHKLAPKQSSESGGTVTFLNYKGAALSVIGKFNSDTIILSYIGFYDDARTTFFATFDISQSQLKVVYRQRAVSMIGCTINIQGSLIGFTYKTSKGVIAGGTDMYESCVAEISDLGQCYRMTAEHVNGPTTETQWLHFLPHRANGSHLLIYVYNTHADLFAVYTAKKSGAHTITAHPHFRNKLAERLCWFQWDEARTMIYILNVKRQIDDRNTLYVLRCIEFPERKPVVSFKASMEMELQMNGMRAKDHIQLVRFGSPGENAYCLCQQHANPLGNVIRVSVWIFHHDIKFDIDIPFVPPPLNFTNALAGSSATSGGLGTSSSSYFEYSPEYLSKVKVFFDSLGDLLVIYVPGVYLQLIDCAVDHEPTVNLILSGPTFNSPLPDVVLGSPSTVETFELRGEAKSGKRLSLLDRIRGLLYEYKLNQNTIVTAASTPDSSLHKQLLALALLHVQDEDTPESIMMSLLRKQPALVSAELMKYFLLGAPFREYRKKTDAVNKRVAALLPILPTAIPNRSPQASPTSPQSSTSTVASSQATSIASPSLAGANSNQSSPMGQGQQKPIAIPSVSGGSSMRKSSPTLSIPVPDSSLSSSSSSSPSNVSSSLNIPYSMQNPSSLGTSLLYSSPLSHSLSSQQGDLGRSIPRPNSPSQLAGQSSLSSSLSSYIPMPSSGSLSDSPSSLSGSSISLGSSWHQPEITVDWSGYALVQKQWPDRASAIQLPASVFMIAGPSDQKIVIHARLWTAGKDPNDSTWQMEHLGGSPNSKLRNRETGSLLTLGRLFSNEDSDNIEWFYLFQSNDGIWYRARLPTCVDPYIGPGFSSSIPVVSIASSTNLSTSVSHKKLSRINLAQLDWQNVHEDFIPQQTVFKKLAGAIGRIFGSSDDAVPKEKTENDDYYDPRRLFITGAYCKHIFENISHSVKATRAECFEWASHYRSLQAAAVGKLYNFIHVCAGDMPQHLLFQVYSNFHEVLEELLLPVPNDFYTKFTVAGYFCLPRHIFMQYAEHGIFQLSRQFVDQIDVRNPEDLRFKHLMLSYLPKDDAISILRGMADGHTYVVEDAVANEPESSVEVDLEDILPNEFLPVGAYLQALGKKKTMSESALKFVGEVSSQQFKKHPTVPSATSSFGKLPFTVRK